MEVLIIVKPDSITAEQKRKPLKEVNIIKLKRSGKLKSSMCANGAVHRKCLAREEVKSLTITPEGILDTIVIDAY